MGRKSLRTPHEKATREFGHHPPENEASGPGPRREADDQAPVDDLVRQGLERALVRLGVLQYGEIQALVDGPLPGDDNRDSEEVWLDCRIERLVLARFSARELRASQCLPTPSVHSTGTPTADWAQPGYTPLPDLTVETRVAATKQRGMPAVVPTHQALEEPRRMTIYYVVPEKRYLDGDPCNFGVDEGVDLSIEQLVERGGWEYVLHHLSDYDETAEGFEAARDCWDHCAQCQALGDAGADPGDYGTSADCEECYAIFDDAHEENTEWMAALLLGIARWAKQRWPGLEIPIGEELEGKDLTVPLQADESLAR